MTRCTWCCLAVLALVGVLAVEACGLGRPEVVGPGVLVESRFVDGAVFRVERWSEETESWQVVEEGEGIYRYPTHLLPREIKGVVEEGGR